MQTAWNILTCRVYFPSETEILLYLLIHRFSLVFNIYRSHPKITYRNKDSYCFAKWNTPGVSKHFRSLFLKSDKGLFFHSNFNVNKCINKCFPNHILTLLCLPWDNRCVLQCYVPPYVFVVILSLIKSGLGVEARSNSCFIYGKDVSALLVFSSGFLNFFHYRMFNIYHRCFPLFGQWIGPTALPLESWAAVTSFSHIC